MSMLNILEKEFNKLNILNEPLPEIITAVADSIPSQNIPYRMKLALAVSEIILYTSQFRINIHHWNDSIVPINAITFCIAKSGASKDSSLRAARKCFEKGYTCIHEYRKQLAVKKAIAKATEAGADIPTRFAGYKDFYHAPNPLFIAISTAEGFIQHLNDLSEDDLGAGFIVSSEVGAELASNANLTENIKLLSELYDLGNKEVKIIKSRDTQSKEVTSLPVSALFIGSQDNLLYDDTVRKKFKTEFSTKLARRSFFVFMHEDLITTDYHSVEELITKEKEIEDKAIQNRNEVSEYIVELTSNLLANKPNLIEVSDEVRDLFLLYKKYNEETANTINNQFPLAKLTRAHLQWKALKLSGALALIQGYDKIELTHYKSAIKFVELINEDVNIFEKELTKEPYELFVNFVKMYSIDGTLFMNLHELRKAGFIPMRSQSDLHLKELVKLANSCDNYGIYEVKNEGISYKAVVKSNTIGISYLECNGTKEQRVKKCSEGFKYTDDYKFEDLSELLQGDFAYSPFKFLNGIRGKDNICSKCSWLALDVDNSEATDIETHTLLAEINHFIVRTSNKDNPYKYRVLIQLDQEVGIPDIQWRTFLELVTTDLGIVADLLAKSQIFFSYSGRDILSITDAEPLPVKPYLTKLNMMELSKPSKPSEESCSEMLNDPLTTFEKAFYAKDGDGRRKLIWAARYARELGASKEYTINLIQQITSYWTKGFPEKDLNIMLNQIKRWNFDATE